MTGHVLFFNKTYGFIRSDEEEDDIFFHFADIISDDYKVLSPGDYVEFELCDDSTKKKAINIKYITEYVDGKKLLAVHVFSIQNGSFELKDFYNQVISKIPSGLKYVNILGDKMVVTSDDIDLDSLIKVVSMDPWPKANQIQTDILPDYAIKLI